MVNEMPIDGKGLHTFRAPNRGEPLLRVEAMWGGFGMACLRLTNEINPPFPEGYNHQRSFGFRIPFVYLCDFFPSFQPLQQRDPGAKGREIDYGPRIGTQLDCIAQTARCLIYD